jgi:outer membrane protein OmpA-like peptidoglycan-associated protein
MEFEMRRLAVLMGFIAVAACSTPVAPPSSFNIFFTANSAALTPEAITAIDRAAAVIKQARPATVAIAAGVASGNNLRLARPRYTAVRQALETRGVSAAIIAQASLPDSGAEVTETGNQRVEIILGR